MLVAEISHDTDDFDVVRSCRREGYTPADGVLLAEGTRSQRFVDDGDSCLRGVVCGGEVTAGADRQRKGREVAGCHEGMTDEPRPLQPVRAALRAAWRRRRWRPPRHWPAVGNLGHPFDTPRTA